MKTENFEKCKIGVILNKITNNFKIEIGQSFKNDKRDLVITDREYKNKNGCNRKYYKYTCNKCGWTEGWIIEYDLLKGKGNGCSCCHKLTVVLGINTMWDTDRWMCDLGVSEEDAKKYTKCTSNKIKVTCPNCGKDKNIKISDIYRYSSISCNCSDKISYPQKFMFSILEQLKINFKTEFNPKWCTYINYNDINKIKTGRYDFLLEDVFIDDKQIIIETDGGFHSKDNKMSGQTKEESEYIDFTKDTLALENGYKVIRIDCSKSNLEYIKNNIINSKLSTLFDLNVIDWNKVQDFALSNLVKEVCNYKKNNPHLSTFDIGKIMNFNNNTIREWLKTGTKLDWCNYDVEKERNNHNTKCKDKLKEMASKPVEIFKDNISLGIFTSCTELERQSENLFGVKLLHPTISKVARGEKCKYKGFYFKYI